MRANPTDAELAGATGLGGEVLLHQRRAGAAGAALAELWTPRDQ